MFTGTKARRVRRIALTTAAVAATFAAPAIVGLASAAPAEAASANLYASVSLSGTLVAGNGVTRRNPHRHGPRRGHVPRRTCRSCAYVATTINAYSQALQGLPAGGHLSPDGVYVETKNQGGGLAQVRSTWSSTAAGPAGRRGRRLLGQPRWAVDARHDTHQPRASAATT